MGEEVITLPHAAPDGAVVAKPHRLVARIGRWGEPEYILECPYTLADRAVRKCNLGDEPATPCLWHLYDTGDHHPDCPAYHQRDAACMAPEGAESCWAEVPEECDGFESTEVGHLHPIEGCWAVHMIQEVGWDDVVSWDKDHLPAPGTDLPLDVDVWTDDEYVRLGVWDPEHKET